MIRLRTLSGSLVVLALVLLPQAAEAEVIIDWVTVGDPGNAPNVYLGRIDYVYRIGKYEVTNAQYCEFLNAVAATDTYQLYNPFMESDPWYDTGGIARTGAPGSYSYSVRPGRAQQPVNYVSWYDAVRFVNWLHNGQPTGAQDASTTEDGAYTLNGYNFLDSTGISRNAGATVWIPSEDEWYKAAAYSGGGTDAGYWEYAVQGNMISHDGPPGSATSANYSPSDGLTDVGAYTLAVSAYGTFDQTGNLAEWNEGSTEGTLARGVRGGSFHDSNAPDDDPNYLRAAQPYSDGYPIVESDWVGFRAAAAIPEPSAFVLLGVAAGLLGCWRVLRCIGRR